MCPGKVPHGGITPRGDNTDHGLVVFMDDQGRFWAAYELPHTEHGEAVVPHSVIQRDHFGFWRRVRHATLALASTRHGEACVVPLDANVSARSGPLREGTPPEVGIDIQVRLRVRGSVPNPTNHTEMER